MDLCLQHLEIFFQALANGKHFALTRFGNGEVPVMQGRDFSTSGTNRHWSHVPRQGLSDQTLTDDLNAAFDLDALNYYVGIAAPCCNRSDHAFYMARLSDERRLQRTTYATLFSNTNWKYLNARFLYTVTETRRPVVLITNWNRNFHRARNALPYNPVDVIPASTEEYDRPVLNERGTGQLTPGCTAWYCDHKTAIVEQYRALAASTRDVIFLVQLGPVANILIHQMFLVNPENTYLDMGHGLDSILFGEVTRGYMAGRDCHVCQDMEVGFAVEAPATGPART